MSTLIVLGSGGHTAEMINVLSALQKDRFMPRVYVAAATDNMSLQKARVLEDSLVDMNGGKVVSAKFMQIYRSREVGQSYITSIGTTLIAIAHALWLMIKIRPQVILCNGPGTCVPLCVIAFLFKLCNLPILKVMEHANVFGEAVVCNRFVNPLGKNSSTPGRAIKYQSADSHPNHSLRFQYEML
ncbi:hypothetical protein GH714_028331 [Hevea brasiliensis]|uniref:UDP-N-acetylglucosamine transferase subunit ALG14 n=1 Tax=Hevea brasiliensis TaxID=3981 RepID=A0A6A6MLN5_HEVBR|nr:hypothetical protein GH714_028331 [Hevea brasiliensis]